MKNFMKRKRLNNKGFTLIELLAVVVILAIVMGISATSVLTSINNSRSSSLYSAAQNAANTLNTWVTEDALVTNAADKMLGDTFVMYTQQTLKDEWVCLTTEVKEGNTVTGTTKNINNRGSSTTLLNALGINENDVVLTAGGSFPSLTGDTTKSYSITAESTCSAIRYNSKSGGYELFLNAKRGGKYFVTTSSDNYAFSRATAVNTSISD